MAALFGETNWLTVQHGGANYAVQVELVASGSADNVRVSAYAKRIYREIEQGPVMRGIQDHGLTPCNSHTAAEGNL